MMKNYLRQVTEVDAACGRIVAEPEAQGLLDRTLVVFTTDNGCFHGEHGLADHDSVARADDSRGGCHRAHPHR